DAGVSLAFFSANNMYWHVRLESSPLGPDREIICYKSAKLDPLSLSHPKETTVRWREAPIDQPESQVIGQQYVAIVTPTIVPMVLAQGARPFLEGTGLQLATALPDLIGGEIDSVGPPVAGRTVTVLAASPVRCKPG